MWFKRSFINLIRLVNDLFKRKLILGKSLLLLVMLLVVMSGLISLGCVRGLQPIGWSGTVAADDGTLFVGSKEGRLVAVNVTDGSRQWSELLKAPRQAGGFGCAPALGCTAASAGTAIYGSPTVAGDLVYIGGYNGKFYAFSSSSLTEAPWIYPREGNLQPIVGGPVVAQGKVYFGGSDGKVYALEATKLSWEWEFQTGDKIWSTPAIEGDTLYNTSLDKKLYAIDATDGIKKWEFLTEGAIASSPLVYNNTVYIGSFDRYVYAVDATDGSLRWRSEAEAGNWFWAKPIVYNNVIYAPCLDGKVYILDAEDGHEVADAIDLGSPINASPVLVNGSVIFASQEGVIYALNTDNNELRLLADIEGEVYSPLCASEGVVYIHTQDLTLHRVDANTGAELMAISLEKPKED